MDTGENAVSLLGSRYLQNFLATGVVGKGYMVLSDKRVYFNGKSMRREGKKFSITR